jgi:hypothetical protein
MVSISSVTGFSQELLADRIEPGRNMTQPGDSFLDTLTAIADNATKNLIFQDSKNSSVSHRFTLLNVSASAYALKINGICI